MRRLPLALAAAVAALTYIAPAAPAAEIFYGITLDNQLATFQSDSPQAVRSSTRLAGLNRRESIIALDVRPNSGELYGLSNRSRLYVIYPASGTVRPVGGPFTPGLVGRSFGFDFDPAADDLRVVSDRRQNLRVDPDTGAVKSADGTLPSGLQGAAFSNTSQRPGTPEPTRLYVIDVAANALAVEEPASGQLTRVGSLGVDVSDPTGFDIASDGRAFLSAGRGGNANLYEVNLATGRARSASREISTRLGNRGETGAQVRALAAAGSVPDDTRRPQLLVAASSRDAARRLRKNYSVAFSCAEWCQVTGTLTRRDGARLAAGNGALATAGTDRIAFRPTRLGRRAQPASAHLVVKAVDAAGNVSTFRQTVQLQ